MDAAFVDPHLQNIRKKSTKRVLKTNHQGEEQVKSTTSASKPFSRDTLKLSARLALALRGQLDARASRSKETLGPGWLTSTCLGWGWPFHPRDGATGWHHWIWVSLMGREGLPEKGHRHHVCSANRPDQPTFRWSLFSQDPPKVSPSIFGLLGKTVLFAWRDSWNSLIVQVYLGMVPQRCVSKFSAKIQL